VVAEEINVVVRLRNGGMLGCRQCTILYFAVPLCGPGDEVLAVLVVGSSCMHSLRQQMLNSAVNRSPGCTHGELPKREEERSDGQLRTQTRFNSCSSICSMFSFPAAASWLLLGCCRRSRAKGGACCRGKQVQAGFNSGWGRGGPV